MVPQYQPQRALDLFSRWIGVQDSPAPPTNAADAANTSKLQQQQQQQHQDQHQDHLSPPKRNPVGSSREADKVESLPGWAGPLPSAQYSGYLDVPLKTGGKKDIHIHYWLSESESEPSTDPVVFWMNGGTLPPHAHPPPPAPILLVHTHTVSSTDLPRFPKRSGEGKRRTPRFKNCVFGRARGNSPFRVVESIPHRHHYRLVVESSDPSTRVSAPLRLLTPSITRRCACFQVQAALPSLAG